MVVTDNHKNGNKSSASHLWLDPLAGLGSLSDTLSPGTHFSCTLCVRSLFPCCTGRETPFILMPIRPRTPHGTKSVSPSHAEEAGPGRRGPATCPRPHGLKGECPDLNPGPSGLPCPDVSPLH